MFPTHLSRKWISRWAFSCHGVKCCASFLTLFAVQKWKRDETVFHQCLLIKFSSSLEESECVLVPVCNLNVSLVMIQMTLYEPSILWRRLLVCFPMLIQAKLNVFGWMLLFFFFIILQCFLDARSLVQSCTRVAVWFGMLYLFSQHFVPRGV